MKHNNTADQDKLLVKAYHKYLDILYHDQTNCFAALGLGNILAYFNKTEDAQEIFKTVNLSNPNIYHPIMNQAHLNVGEKKF